MAYFASRGLRGSGFEELINATNEAYRQKGLALIQKIPTSITPIELDNETRTIKKAYFEKKSTVDYLGAVQGIPVCFDAKETFQKSFPLKNIHEHQLIFMNDFALQKGVAFIIIRFAFCDEMFLCTLEMLNEFMSNAKKGGRKSIPYNAFDRRLLVKQSGLFFVHYLEALNTYLNIKNF